MKLPEWTLPLILLTALPLRGEVTRALSVEAPAEAVAGSTVAVVFMAGTDATDGEQIASFDAEYTLDEGETWTSLYRAEHCGAQLTFKTGFAVRPEGGRAIVRARAAFRGGAAGDVDCNGNALQWHGSWQRWRWPPAKYVVIQVPAPPVEVAPARTAVTRVISIQAPVEAAAGSTVPVTFTITTDAGDGEHICFPHGQYSIDDGKTWTQIYYEEKVGAELSRKVSIATNPRGGKTIVRIRAAFRGGAAGDVDAWGRTMQWGEHWEMWQAPVAKYFVIYPTKS